MCSNTHPITLYTQCLDKLIAIGGCQQREMGSQVSVLEAILIIAGSASHHHDNAYWCTLEPTQHQYPLHTLSDVIWFSQKNHSLLVSRVLPWNWHHVMLLESDYSLTLIMNSNTSCANLEDAGLRLCPCDTFLWVPYFVRINTPGMKVENEPSTLPDCNTIICVDC